MGVSALSQSESNAALYFNVPDQGDGGKRGFSELDDYAVSLGVKTAYAIRNLREQEWFKEWMWNTDVDSCVSQYHESQASESKHVGLISHNLGTLSGVLFLKVSFVEIALAQPVVAKEALVAGAVNYRYSKVRYCEEKPAIVHHVLMPLNSPLGQAEASRQIYLMGKE